MNKNGYTLIELLISICIIAIVTSATVMMYTGLLHSTTDQKKNLSMQQNGRSALRFIANELLAAGYSPTSNLKDNITGQITDKIIRAGTTSITYNLDANANDHAETNTISFNKVNGQLMYNSSEVILDNVVAFALLYAYDTEDTGGQDFGVLESSSNRINWAYGQDSCETTDPNRPCTLQSSYYYDNNDILRQGSAVSYQGASVSINRIRAVKIMILVRSESFRRSHVPPRTGFRIPEPQQSNGFMLPSSLNTKFYHRFFTTTVKLRNMFYL